LGRLGHATKLKWNALGEWIWSQEPVHEPLIDTGAFEQVQALYRAKGSAEERSPRRTPCGYALRGIMRCGICKRKMQGSWNNGKPHIAARSSASTPEEPFMAGVMTGPDRTRPRTRQWGSAGRRSRWASCGCAPAPRRRSGCWNGPRLGAHRPDGRPQGFDRRDRPGAAWAFTAYAVCSSARVV